MASWLARSFLSASQKRLFRTGVPVFMLHKIALPPRQAVDPFDYMAPDELDRKLGELRHAGFSPVTLDDFVSRRARTGDSFVLTFDDGYRNVVQQAIPVLARHGVKAIQFLVVDRLGRDNDWDVAKGEVNEPLMTRDEVQEWLANGHAIGSHTSSHPNLKRLSPDQAREEISGSRKRLEDIFGVPVNHFSYPSGKFNDSISEIVREAGYQSACTVEFGVNSDSTPLFRLNRISPLTSLELIRKACHRLLRARGIRTSA